MSKKQTEKEKTEKEQMNFAMANDFENGMTAKEIVEKWQGRYPVRIRHGDVMRLVNRYCSQRYLQRRQNHLVEEIRNLTAQGYSRAEVSERLDIGINETYTLYHIAFEKKEDDDKYLTVGAINNFRESVKVGDEIDTVLLFEEQTDLGWHRVWKLAHIRVTAKYGEFAEVILNGRNKSFRWADIAAGILRREGKAS